LLRPLSPHPESFQGIEIASLKIDDLNLLPVNQGDWHIKLAKFHIFDYDVIEQSFDNFINSKLKLYEQDRNNLESNSNAIISHYLRFGILSPRVCFHKALLSTGGANQFLLELLWREFAYYTLFFNKNIAKDEIKQPYSKFHWDNNSSFIEKWKKSQTGYDIVDAAMNELYTTGLMHGRARMITASFFIKDLLCDWRLGEEWFWDTLVDADPAINPFSWQWVFGSGLDAAPYFRIFNPQTQAQRFDPNLSYRKKWLNLPTYNHYNQIISHEIQRDIAMQRYKKILI
jgi:deoxyribodipyrimidine photo-lyase